MAFDPLVLFRAPVVNPINKKAKSIPALNPFNVYGRVFTFSWVGFFVAFLSWYAWAPLISKTIKADIHLTQNEIANSNIVGLTATLLVRAVAGPLCDRFGPRYVFAGTLIAGAIPTAFAFSVRNATDLIVLRFFIGILGGSFVPCQVWSTGFFDKNIVGTANAFTGGFGNSGGGVTYWVMPAIFNTFEHTYHLKAHDAWRRAFFVPFAIIISVAVLMVLLCPDTPTGKWSERFNAVEHNLQAEHDSGHHIAHSGLGEERRTSHAVLHEKGEKSSETSGDIERIQGEVIEIDAEYTHEVVQKPTPMEILKVILSPQTLVLCACYFNSFGSELAVNGILGAYYLKNFPKFTQTTSGNWAAMFGVLNVYGRPLGGITADLIYKYTNGNLWAKKMLIHFLGISMAIFMIAIGFTNSHDLKTMVGLVAGLAVSYRSILTRPIHIADAIYSSSWMLVTELHTLSFLTFTHTPTESCPVSSVPLVILAVLLVPLSSDIWVLNTTRAFIF
jgi:NNP family nitrate/nitrite transporter-like MFS transporter